MDASNYSQALRQLLPRGAAWHAEGAALGQLLDALAAEMARVDGRAAVLLREALPGTSSELLTDWERVLGLPDPCVTEPQTLSERRLAAHTRFTLAGGQSKAFFIALAASLGYTVTVEDFPSAAAATSAGITFTGDGWAYSWRVNVAAGTNVRTFRVGQSSAGDPLRSWGDEQIECLIKRYAPAHTIVFIAYL